MILKHLISKGNEIHRFAIPLGVANCSSNSNISNLNKITIQRRVDSCISSFTLFLSSFGQNLRVFFLKKCSLVLKRDEIQPFEEKLEEAHTCMEPIYGLREKILHVATTAQQIIPQYIIALYTLYCSVERSRV